MSLLNNFNKKDDVSIYNFSKKDAFTGNVFQPTESSKDMTLIFCKLQSSKSSKNMGVIFCKLQKAKKTWL